MNYLNILGVVIVYNPDDDFIYNISTYIDSLSILLVIENSKLDLVTKKKLNNIYPNKIVFKSLGGNYGISIPLNYALTYSRKHKFTHILTMDQDSSFPPGEFISFLDASKRTFETNSKVCMCAPNISVNNVELNDDEGSLFITSGNLIDVIRLGSISYDKNIFIDGVDFDLCMSIKRANLKAVLISNSTMYHNLGESSSYKFFNLSLISTNHSVIRLYYIFRNYTYLIFKDNSKTFRFKLFKLLVQFVLAIVIKEDNKIMRLKFCIMGLCDALIKKMGYRY